MHIYGLLFHVCAHVARAAQCACVRAYARTHEEREERRLTESNVFRNTQQSRNSAYVPCVRYAYIEEAQSVRLMAIHTRTRYMCRLEDGI